MRVPLHLLLSSRAKATNVVRRFATCPAPPYGRTASYRRICHKLSNTTNFLPLTPSSRSSFLIPAFFLLSRPSSFPSRIKSRSFASSSQRLDTTPQNDDFPSRPASNKSSESESARTSTQDNFEGDGRAKQSSTGSSEGSSEKSSKSSDANSGSNKRSDSKEKQRAEPPPPPPHGDKTPWQVFKETLSQEFQASKEWNESTKALASSAHQFSENESVKRARAAYTAASGAATSTTSSALKGTSKLLGKGAAWTWDTPVVKGVRSGVAATGRGIEKVTKPVRETNVYKTTMGGVKEVIDDGSSSRYGGWVEKEERRKQRELSNLNKGAEKVVEDPNAGTNVTLHKDAAWKESWRDFKDSNRVVQSLFSLKSSYNESDNPLVSTARSITDRVASFFAETESARVIKKFREMDPSFQVEPFLREMREYILPEVLDAYVKGDTDTLKLWLSAAQFQVYAALTQQYTTAGLKSDGRILDIRHVDIQSSRLLEPGEIPVFIITCRTQEVHVYRDVKTNQLAAGMEDRVQLVIYAIGLTRVPEDVNNADTRGWRLIELQKTARDWI